MPPASDCLRRVAVIANPIAGANHGHSPAQELVDLLVHRGHEAQLLLTKGPAHARDHARNAAPHADLLVAAGGDGTVNEVLNGLPDPARTPITALPLGTANMLGHELRLPRTASGLADIIARGRTGLFDLGMATRLPDDSAHPPPGASAQERRLLLVASAGFDAMVIHHISAHRRGPQGLRRYVGPILRTACTYQPPRLTVHTPGQAPVQAELAVVANARNYGGLFHVARAARLDSGLLHAVVLRRASRLRLLVAALRALAARVAPCVALPGQAVRSVEVRSDEPVPVQLDGDPFGFTPVQFSVIPRGVRLLLP